MSKDSKEEITHPGRDGDAELIRMRSTDISAG